MDLSASEAVRLNKEEAIGFMSKRIPPKEHPPAWGSPLWPPLETIRKMRRQRKTWVSISKLLQEEHGLTITYRTVRKFFKRASKNDLKLPLGFPTEPDSESPAPFKPGPESTLKTPDQIESEIIDDHDVNSRQEVRKARAWQP